MYYTYVYLHPDGTPMYVGKGCGTRVSDHVKKHGNSGFKAALTSLFVNGLEPIALKVIEDVSFEKAFELEKELIAYLGRRVLGTGPLYNIAKGGNGGAGPRSEDVKRRISASLSGKPKSAQTIARMRRHRPSLKQKRLLSTLLSGVGNGQSKAWLVQSPNGDVQKIDALHAFCVKNELAYTSLLGTLKSRKSVMLGKSAGWKIVEKLGPSRPA